LIQEIICFNAGVINNIKRSFFKKYNNFNFENYYTIEKAKSQKLVAARATEIFSDLCR
jgi:hypothetical protein